jgi:4-hydroxy-3-methylbut-2-enyl diphosphate reductase
MPKKIVVDQNSGFCFGVINAIRTAEKYLMEHSTLYCLGDIVHNSEEVQRLSDIGLQIIDYDQFMSLKDTTVLIRAHGEPPETYHIAEENNIHLIDATCPVVLKLQKRILGEYMRNKSGKQILIYGKKGHAEVIGLLGQTENTGIVISSPEDINCIDGVKISFEAERKWVHLRRSNTEPIIRIYSEAPTMEEAEALAAEVVGVADTIIKG